MKTEYIFPLLLIMLNFGAALVYGVNGNIRKVIYWLAAALLNIAVTF